MLFQVFRTLHKNFMLSTTDQPQVAKNVYSNQYVWKPNLTIYTGYVSTWCHVTKCPGDACCDL